MEVSLTEDIQPALGATDMEDNGADPNLAGLAGDVDSDDEDLLGFSLEKVCSQSTRSSAPDNAEGGGGGPGTPQAVQGEPTAEEGKEDVEAEAEEQPVHQAMDAESGDDVFEDYICPVVENLDELKWTRWATDWRPCRLLNEGDYTTRKDLATTDQGHVHVELFPLKSETSYNNVVEVPKDKLRAFNDSVEGAARIWSPALKAEMLKTKRKRKASIAMNKAKTSVSKLQSAMNFAEECLKKSIKAIDEKEEKRRREELQEEEELAAMGVQVPMEIEEQPQEEAKEEGDEASTETAFEERSRFRDKSYVKLRPGDIVRYKRDGAHMTEPALSMVLAVKPGNMRSKDAILAGCLVQLLDESWLGPKDTMVKTKRAKPNMRHEDVSVKDQRLMKVEDHHLVPGAPAGWNMADIETEQQAVAKIFAEGVSNIEELFQQHILNKRPRKSKAPAQEGEKAAEKAEEQPEEQAEGEAAGSAGESKPRGRSKTPLGGQKANAE